ncbi:MAG: hypothetical protein RIS53_784 [Bacillota bacterium]
MDNFYGKFQENKVKIQKTSDGRFFLIRYGAGDGNRTRVSTLARLCSTIELHLQRFYIIAIVER